MKKKFGSFIRILASLKIAIILLVLIAIYSIIGTLLPQHMPEAWYLEQYPTLGPAINLLALGGAYSSPVFSILLALFIINLSACSLLSLKGQLKQARKDFFPTITNTDHVLEDCDSEQVSAYAKRKHFNSEKTSEGFRAGAFRWGVLGSTITHLGIILLFAGGILGTVKAQEDSINLIPGQEIEFNVKGFSLRLDDFEMTFQENGAVKQYYSTFTLTEADGTQREQTLWVNKPLSHGGIKFYQASYGWVSNLRITDKNTGAVLVEGLLQNDKEYFYQPGHLTVYLYGYFPEMGIGHDQVPVSLSNRELNPHYAVILSEFGNSVGSYIIAPGETIAYGDLLVTFTNSIAYTGILFRTDPSFPVIMLGFIIMLLGMSMSFYLYPRFMEYKSGSLYLFSRKNGWVFFNAVRTQLDSQKKSNPQPKKDQS